MCHCAYRPCPRLVTSTCTSTEYCNQGASKLSNTTDWAAEIARGGQITAPPSGPRIPWAEEEEDDTYEEVPRDEVEKG